MQLVVLMVLASTFSSLLLLVVVCGCTPKRGTLGCFLNLYLPINFLIQKVTFRIQIHSEESFCFTLLIVRTPRLRAACGVIGGCRCAVWRKRHAAWHAVCWEGIIRIPGLARVLPLGVMSTSEASDNSVPPSHPLCFWFFVHSRGH